MEDKKYPITLVHLQWVELMIDIINSKIGIPFFVSIVSNHDNVKMQLLEDISSMGVFGSITNGQSIYNSDWFLNNQIKKAYLPTVIPLFENHNYELAKIFNAKNVNIENVWFQQYQTGDYHGWHAHPSSLFSNVYYVDLCDDSPKTSFRILNQELEVQVSEGMIITFPSFIQHCSKPNKSSKIKTIISYNSSYREVIDVGDVNE